MTDLLKAFDSYNDFERKSYFTLLYETLSSELLLEVPLKASKQNMQAALDHLAVPEDEYQLVFKNWHTEDSSNSDFSKDYAYEYLLRSNKRKSIVYISLTESILYVEFLYDCSDSKLEEWVIVTNHKLRQKYGLDRTPTFKVLIKNRDGFKTDDVRFDSQEVDITTHYNADFKAINEVIQKSFDITGSGLILFHGIPGTGKTTYIKSLIADHPDSNFIFVQNEFIKHLLEPDFISFLLKQRNSVLIIEDAEKILTTRTHLREDSFVSTILQLTDGLFSDYLNIKIICTFNISLSQIDSALMRKGRMIAKYEFKSLEKTRTAALLSKLGITESDKELTIAEIYNYDQEAFEDEGARKIGF